MRFTSSALAASLTPRTQKGSGASPSRRPLRHGSCWHAWAPPLGSTIQLCHPGPRLKLKVALNHVFVGCVGVLSPVSLCVHPMHAGSSAHLTSASSKVNHPS